MNPKSADEIKDEVDARIPWRNKNFQFWHDFPINPPETVAGFVDDRVRHGAYICLELGSVARDEYVPSPLSEEQRDDLLFTSRICADGAQALAGLSYKIAFENRRLWWATLALASVNTVLLMVTILILLGR